MKPKRFKATISLVLVVFILILAVAVYFGYRGKSHKLNSQTACTQELKLCSNNYTYVGRIGLNCKFAPCPTLSPESVYISSPRVDTKLTSPLTITGTVPAGWIFEGVFPIRLEEDSGTILAQGLAKEKIPGSWQSGKPVDFTTTLTFTKSYIGQASLILERANPSGNPTKSDSYGVPVSLNCSPRPICLDSVPRCLVPETKDMCPKVFYY
jgi:hypothetical protein